ESAQNDSHILLIPGEAETQWCTKEGRARDIWVGTSIIKDLDGKVVRSRCAARDITERNQLAHAVVGRARELEQANGELRRVIRVEKPLPAVQGDPERITQLLSNLIGNALKYNESERPEVVIGAADRGTWPYATLFVRDNGVGIDPRYHEQIFRIFRRLHRRD